MNENTYKKNRRERHGHNIPITFTSSSGLSVDEIVELERHTADTWLSPRASGRSRIRIRWLS